MPSASQGNSRSWFKIHVSARECCAKAQASRQSRWCRWRWRSGRIRRSFSALAKVLLYDGLQIPHPQGLKLLRWTGDDKVVAQSFWGDFDNTPGGGMTSSVFSYPIYREMSLHPAGMQSLAEAFEEASMNATSAGNGPQCHCWQW